MNGCTKVNAIRQRAGEMQHTDRRWNIPYNGFKKECHAGKHFRWAWGVHLKECLWAWGAKLTD